MGRYTRKPARYPINSAAPAPPAGARAEMANMSGNDIKDMLRVPERFTVLSKLVTRDLNGRTRTPTFKRYTKDDITSYLENPYRYEKQLRDAVVYLYGASSHFRRIIQYFVSLSDLSYVVSPYRIDPRGANAKAIGRNYRKTLNTLASMRIRSQCPNILTVCLREDVFYGTMWVTNDDITIQQLPSDYCAIATVEGGVPNVSFNFSYFDANGDMLPFYPKEFENRYNDYLKDRTGLKWQELSSPTSFAVKCNREILDYAIPPFAGILREIYDIEDYKLLKKTKTELENYAILVMTLGIDKDGNWQIDLEKAKEFWRNLDAVLPEEIGSILTPMPIEKISFDRSNVGDTNTIADAEERLFSAAGISSLLFNNTKATSSALLLSIKADQEITFGIVKGIEAVINRYIQAQPYGKNFVVTFLNCSEYNRKELGDMYLKMCQYGLPMVSFLCASQGLDQTEMDAMNFLENDVLGLKEKLIPLKSSATQSSSDGDEGGAPTKDIGEASDKTEANNESESGDEA